MNWSVSSGQMFKQCPRKWFFSNIAYSTSPKDELQREIKFLKKLQTIQTWRGKLVDEVITEYAIPILNKKEMIYEQNIVEYGKERAAKELRLAIDHAKGKETQGEVIALLELENNREIDQSLLETTYSEIDTSLRNFVKSNFVKEFLQHGRRIIAQRPLQYNNGEILIKCKPDAIVLYNDRNAVIVDWKVKAFSHLDHKKQLAIYAYVISKVNPHNDLKDVWNIYFSDPTKIDLLEFQLLHGRERFYNFSQSDITEIEDFIYLSSNDMIQLTSGKRYPNILPSQIPTTEQPGNCQRCQFKRICWEPNRICQ